MFCKELEKVVNFLPAFLKPNNLRKELQVV